VPHLRLSGDGEDSAKDSLAAFASNGGLGYRPYVPGFVGEEDGDALVEDLRLLVTESPLALPVELLDLPCRREVPPGKGRSLYGA
jgi:hypothetical protein